MAQGVSGLAQPESALAFWEHLSAVLTDEVVLAEAQAVGMDWPEVADGRALLAGTRRELVEIATEHGWIAADTAPALLDPDPSVALAAARPWIEQAQREMFAALAAPAVTAG